MEYVYVVYDITNNIEVSRFRFMGNHMFNGNHPKIIKNIPPLQKADLTSMELHPLRLPRPSIDPSRVCT